MNNNKKTERTVVCYFKKYRWVLAFALAVALAAGIFSWRNAGRFSVSSSITISRLGSQAATDYKFDNYYALKATDEFGDTVVGWFKTPELARAVAQKAGVVAAGSLSGMSQQYKATKISPSVVEARYSVSSEDEAKKINQAIGVFLREKTDLLNSSSAQGISFLILMGEPVVAENSFSLWLNVAAGFLVGLIFGLFIQAAGEYFKV